MDREEGERGADFLLVADACRSAPRITRLEIKCNIRDSDFPGQSIINSRVGSLQSPVHDVFLIVGLHAVKSDTWVTRVILYEEFKEI